MLALKGFVQPQSPLFVGCGRRTAGGAAEGLGPSLSGAPFRQLSSVYDRRRIGDRVRRRNRWEEHLRGDHLPGGRRFSPDCIARAQDGRRLLWIGASLELDSERELPLRPVWRELGRGGESDSADHPEYRAPIRNGGSEEVLHRGTRSDDCK